MRTLVSSTCTASAPSTFCMSFIANASSLFCSVKLSTGSASARLTMKPVTRGMPAGGGGKGGGMPTCLHTGFSTQLSTQASSNPASMSWMCSHLSLLESMHYHLSRHSGPHREAGPHISAPSVTHPYWPGPPPAGYPLSDLHKRGGTQERRGGGGRNACQATESRGQA